MSVHITGDFFGTRDIGELEALLTGTRFTHRDIGTFLEICRIDDFIAGASPEEITALLMGAV